MGLTTEGDLELSALLGPGFSLSAAALWSALAGFHTLLYQTFQAVSFPTTKPLQLSAMDASARTTMKGAAKCDKHCELQNSVNQ